MGVLGTITSDFLAPGVSRNGRLYTPEVITRAVARMQSRLADPDGLPITMRSWHDPQAQSREIAARVTSVALNEDHLATLHGYLVDTAAGRDIAAATSPGPDGRRVLDSVSIWGWWLGEVYQVEHDGQMVETADDLEIEAVDFTPFPGVAKARIRAAQPAAGATESVRRTPITESVEVTVMPDSRLVYSTSTPTPPAPAAAPPAPAAAAESAPATDPNPLAPVLAAIREARVAVGGWQGPVDVDLSAYGLNNDDVAAAATQLGAAYTAALRVLDPDNDDDLDLPGGDVEENPCAGCGAVLPDGAAFCPACGAQVDETAPPTNTLEENTDMPENDQAAEAAAAASRRLLGVTEDAPADAPAPGAQTPAAPAPPAPAAPAVDADGDEDDDEAAESGQEAPAESAAPAAAPVGETAAPAAPAVPQGTVTLTLEEFMRLTAAGSPAAPAAETAAPAAAPAAPAAPAAEAAPAAGPAQGITVEAFDAAVKAAAEQAADKMRAEMLAAYGPPGRKGLVEAAQKLTDKDAPALHQLSQAELNQRAAGVWDQVFQLPG